MNDYYRPADYQVEGEYVCRKCNQEKRVPMNHNAPECCGEEMMKCGEMYPADVNDWEEQRDPDGEWRPRR